MLYICATPIGNLQDITLRAITTLQQADIILCEDTRVSKKLLQAHNITYKKLISLHAHNEEHISQEVLKWLADGLNIVQITDAGTPNISDPGAKLCQIVLNAGFPVTPIPGACAYISLLSISGLPYHTLFYGFLPATSNKRIKAITAFIASQYAICTYEAPHRIIDTIQAIIDILGANTMITMGRELTKQFETIKQLSAQELLNFIISDKYQQKGEFVLIIHPNITNNNCNKQNHDIILSSENIKLINILAKKMPPKEAANIASEITNIHKDIYYQYLLTQKLSL